MAILKSKDIRKLSEKEIEEKIKDLKMELVKSKVAASKGGKLKIKEIKRTIARLYTISRLKQTFLSKKVWTKKTFCDKRLTKIKSLLKNKQTWIYAPNADCRCKLVFAMK